MIARMPSLVILNSISMANGSSSPGLYSSLNSSWITVRCLPNCASWSSLMSSCPSGTWFEVARTAYEPLGFNKISSGIECASGLVTRSSPSCVLT